MGDLSPGGNDITKVTWHRNMPGQFQVVFGNGRMERRPGGRPEANALATSLGFVLSSDPIDDYLAEWSIETNS
jgi:hypothetical protein